MATSTAPSFARVAENFQRFLTPEQARDFRYTTLGDLKTAIDNIQETQAGKYGLRNLRRILPFIHGLEQYTGVLEVFVQVKPDVLGLIWGPIKLCLQIASKAANAFDALLDAYQKIGASLPIIAAIDTLFFTKPHVQQVLANVYEDILNFHKRGVAFFKNGTWRLTFKLTYRTLDDMFGDVLKNLERSKDLLMQAADVAHFQEAQETRLFWVKDYEERRERDKKARMVAVIEWLSSDHTYRVKQQALRRIRSHLPQTTQWILKDPRIKDWLEHSEIPTFWLCGIPGAGKTVLFSSVIDELESTSADSEVIYFYCKNGDPQRSSFNTIARSLILQILQKDATCLDYLFETIIASGEHQPKSSDVLHQLLENLITCRNSVIIAVDGLDECDEPERSLIFSFIEAVSTYDSLGRNVKFFLTSRKENDICSALESARCLHIKQQHVEDDIQAYIKFQATRLSQKFDFDKAREDIIVKDISTRPKGMFLLARLIMENLLDQDTLDDIEEELRSDILPNGIDDAYRRLLKRIGKDRSGKDRPEKSQRRAATVLGIITAAKRPLKSHEIHGALSISVVERNVDFVRRKLRTPVEELCGPILEVTADGGIDLIHPTAKDYLSQRHSGPYLDPVCAKIEMTRLCLSYLTFVCHDSALTETEMQRSVQNGDYAFLEYSARYWVQHVISLITTWERLQPSDRRFVYHTSLTLYERDTQGKLVHDIANVEATVCDQNSLEKLMAVLHDAYERTESIDEADGAKAIPLTLKGVYKVRRSIEKLFLRLRKSRV